jgi:hypothetical protein
MLQKGYITSFGAKDTHYYWALDPDALPTTAPLSGVYDIISKFNDQTNFKSTTFR